MRQSGVVFYYTRAHDARCIRKSGRSALLSLPRLVWRPRLSALFCCGCKLRSLKAQVVLLHNTISITPRCPTLRRVPLRPELAQKNEVTAGHIKNVRDNGHRPIGVGAHHEAFCVRAEVIVQVQDTASTSSGGCCSCCYCCCNCCSEFCCSCGCSCWEALFVCSPGLQQTGALPRERLQVSQSNQRSCFSPHGFYTPADHRPRPATTV